MNSHKEKASYVDAFAMSTKIILDFLRKYKLFIIAL